MTKLPFTTIKIEGSAQNLKYHYNRLVTACEELKIQFTLTYEMFCEEVKCVVNENAGKYNGLKVVVLKSGKLDYQLRDYKLSKENYALKTKVVSERQTPKFKLYPNNDVLRHIEDLENYKYDDYLYVVNGEVCETLIANIFYVIDDVIYTPPLTKDILAGTIRAFLIDNCNVIERPLNYNELDKCDEVFITNSIKQIQCVTEIDGHQYDIHTQTLALLTSLKNKLTASDA